MSDTHNVEYNLDERYDFTASAKKKLMITLLVGVGLLILGLLLAMNAGGEHAEEGGHGINQLTEQTSPLLASTEGSISSAVGVAAEEGEHHGSPIWLKRLYVTLWHNNVFFTGLSLIGLFFVAIQYAAQAGWSAGIQRIPEAMGTWLPIAGVLAVVLFFVAGGDIFHWTHTDLYVEGSATFDAIINGKKSFFFWPADEHPGFPIFWFARLIIFFGLWYWFFTMIRGWSLKEDTEGGTTPWLKNRSRSAIFLVIFGITSSIAAWDWIMSIDTHWFSTMFGWYTFASWWLSGLAFITLLVVYLKEKGLLGIVDSNHLHDLGKFIFAFSIFWTYIWFSQFLLIYYANIPEESIYFLERLNTQYAPVFYINILINFIFPFLLLMTRDAKRTMVFLKIVGVGVIAGHWIDFYLMITPGTMHFDGTFGFMEIGVTMIFLSLFLYVVLSNLSKVPLIAKNHPMLKESLHHHI